MSESGGPRPGTMILGEEATPPFAVLPDHNTLFLGRSNRLGALAPNHQLEPYLSFLALLTRAQHEIQADLPPAMLPPSERIAQALEHGMPPVARTLHQTDESVQLTIGRLLDRVASADVPAQTAAAVEAVRGATPQERKRLAEAVLEDFAPTHDPAQTALVAAGLQVHFARVAALLAANDLKPIADGACPVCGCAPMTSSIVGWPKAHNTRFCTCWLCATMWNVVRIKCVLCGSMKGISYKSIDGQPDAVKAETCDECQGYLKIFYQVNDAALEPLADDVASLGLDMLLAEDGWRRGGRNPFLLGY